MPGPLATGTIYYPTTTTRLNTSRWPTPPPGRSRGQIKAEYNALEVDLRRNFWPMVWPTPRQSYTCAKNLDDGTAWNTSVSANTPAFVEYPYAAGISITGPAATDIRHLAAINASYASAFRQE